MRLSISLALVSALALSACSSSGRASFDAATTDPSYYQSRNFIDVARAGGYASEVLAKDRYQVDVRTNTVTSPGRAVAIALTRAAELARENGFDYFRLESVNARVSCVTGGMGGPIQSATPYADLTAKAGALSDFETNARVFDVAKIESNLRPELMTAAPVRGIAAQVALSNRNSCYSSGIVSDGGVGREMPWETHDILYQPVDQTPSLLN